MHIYSKKILNFTNFRQKISNDCIKILWQNSKSSIKNQVTTLSLYLLRLLPINEYVIGFITLVFTLLVFKSIWSPNCKEYYIVVAFGQLTVVALTIHLIFVIYNFYYFGTSVKIIRGAFNNHGDKMKWHGWSNVHVT